MKGLAILSMVLLAAATLPIQADRLSAVPAQSGLSSAQGASGASPAGAALAVMTYNVHGLPWPLATGRSDDLAAIAGRLRQLHAEGQAPHVVVLQEVFTGEARAMSLHAGYRHVVFGPGADDGLNMPEPADGGWRALLPGESWLRGEGLGKVLGSGLAILSDYPISNVRRMTYSDPVCAGYDCLAAKGAMIVRLTLPDGRQVEVATTHMNSRGATEVAPQRADLAWREQGEELATFIRQNRNSRLPLILGGDFNVGRSEPRQSGMAVLLDKLGCGAGDGLHALARSGTALSNDAQRSLYRGKDWEIALAGTATRMIARAAEVPFGANGGAPLSDHYGYEIRYAFNETGSNRPT